MGSLTLDRCHFCFLMILKETLIFLSLSNPDEWGMGQEEVRNRRQCRTEDVEKMLIPFWTHAILRANSSSSSLTEVDSSILFILLLWATADVWPDVWLEVWLDASLDAWLDTWFFPFFFPLLPISAFPLPFDFASIRNWWWKTINGRGFPSRIGKSPFIRFWIIQLTSQYK